MEALAAFLQLLINKVVGIATWFLQVFVQFFVDGWEIFTDLLCWGFDQALGVAVAALSAASDLPGFSAITTAAGWFGNIPGDMLNILGLIGFGQAVGVIAAALGIRFVLGLIPFVRVGG